MHAELTVYRHRPNIMLGTVWEEYERIDPVAILYGNGPRLEITEHNSARRLLRELWRLGRSRIRIRGAICSKGALSPYNLAAFNCYLQHHFAAQSFSALRVAGLHRFNWYAMQQTIPLIWTA